MSMVSWVSWGCSDQAAGISWFQNPISAGSKKCLLEGTVGVISRCHHPRKRVIQYAAAPRLTVGPAITGYPAFAGYDSRGSACFPALLAPNRDREIGGGRATRQPGQVRKEAALTRSGSGRSSVSYLFFRANRAGSGLSPLPRLIWLLSAIRP